MKINKILKFIFLSIFTILIFSCASKPQNEFPVTCKNLKPVYITDSKKIFLLHPAYNSSIVDSLQLLEGNFDKQTFSLLIYSQIDSKAISLSLFNDFGTDMGNVSFNENNVIFDSAFFPASLPGEYIIADIQNAYYDINALSQNYKKSKLIFYSELNEKNNSEKRFIYDGSKLIEEIQISKKGIIIINYLRNYKYELINEN